MKYLFFSKHGDSAGVAHRVQQEGNDVWLYIPESWAKPTLEGIVPQVKSVSEGLSKKPDVVFFDMVGSGPIATRIQRLGYNVIGSGATFKGRPFQDDMELDRDFGMDLMEAAGIAVPKTEEFKGSEIDKAIAYAKASKMRLVAKPNGNKNAYMTHVAENEEDMTGHLQYMKENKLVTAGEDFILQEFVDGVEISTEMWFTKGKPIFPSNGTMETKKFLVGDLGPNTGCQTSLVWFYEKKEPKIVQQTLKKMFTILEKLEYTGPLDLNCIVSRNDHKPYGIEWTARPGYSAIYAMIRLLDVDKYDLGKHLHWIATGELLEWYHKIGFGYSLRVSIPPYPLCIPDEKQRQEWLAETAGHRLDYKGKTECFFPLDLKASKDGNDDMVTAGVDGVVCELAGYGATVEDAKNEAHAQLKKLYIPEKQARLDGWKRPLKDLPQLKAWGFEVPDAGTK